MLSLDSSLGFVNKGYALGLRFTALGSILPMKSGCIFPQGATGDSDLLSEMQSKLPGFDNKMLIEAMCSTDNNRFLIWERKC